MKKIVWLIIFLFSMLPFLHAGDNYDVSLASPTSFDRTTNAMILYVSATSTSSYSTFADSMSISGLFGSTTYYLFSDAAYDTIGELISFLNGKTGCTATRVQGVYSETPSTQLTETLSGDCSVSTCTLAMDNILGISYILPALTNGKRYCLTSFSANATFATGNAFIAVYDGTDTTDGRLKKEQITTSAVNYPLNLGNNERDNVFGAINRAMRYDVWSSTWVTDGWLDFTVYTR